MKVLVLIELEYVLSVILKKKENVVLKMLLWKRAKAQLIWNKWLSRRIVLCNQFKYTPSGICVVTKFTFNLHKVFRGLLTELSKAFDCLNHELLFAKLNAHGFTLPALKLVYEHLPDRKQRTRVNI